MSSTITRHPANTLPVEVRQAVERLSRLDRAGALAAEEAADVRALLAYVSEAGR